MLESGLFWWLICDRCGVKSTEDGEFAAWSSARDAEDEASWSDWYVEDDHHICYDCQPHAPDWDDEHEAAYRGETELDCSYCQPVEYIKSSTD